MDAFYAAVEQRDRPELRGRPIIVGGDAQRRGVVSACSYEARPFGVRSAMGVAQALRLCPQAIVVPVRMDRYHEISEQIMTLLHNFSPAVQQISIDEAFIDMTGTERLFGSPTAAATRLKGAVRTATGLTVSVGIGATRYIAKMASEVRKPDGLFAVEPGEEADFVANRALADLWGLGKQTLRRLNGLGITTVAELRAQRIEVLRGHLGESTAQFLFQACRGIDPGIYSGHGDRHSVSTERTFAQDTADRQLLHRALLEMTGEVALRLVREQWRGPVVRIKFRYANFETHAAQRTLDHPVASAAELQAVAERLFYERWNGAPLRLVGVGVAGGAETPPEQGELFSAPRAAVLDQTIAAIEDRFGRTAIRRGSTL